MKRLGWGREVAANYTKEFRCLIRDQHTIIYSVVIPVFLYPALVWGLVQVLTYARAIQDRVVSTVRLIGDDPLDGLRKHLEDTAKLRVVESDTGDRAGGDAGKAHHAGERNAGGLGSESSESMQTLSEGARKETPALASASVDAWVLVEKGGSARGEHGLHSGVELKVLFNSSLDASIKARERLEEAITAYRRERLVLAARDIGQGEEFVSPLAVTETDLASREEFSKYMASLILPLLMLVMTALGALYPALDVTVGEKERGCLETTLLAPVGRASIVVGKYLAVVSFALIAFVLNFTSMAFTLFHQGSVLKLQPFEFHWSTGAIILAAALLLSAFFSAIMMFLAFQARTFKEGQSYVMPVYLLAVLPTLVVASPEATFDMRTAWVPVVNIALLFRGALQGNLSTDTALAALSSAVFYAAVVLAFAVRYLRRQEVVAERVGWGFFRGTRRRGSYAEAFAPPVRTGEVRSPKSEVRSPNDDIMKQSG